jgi:hypothetical protein
MDSAFLLLLLAVFSGFSCLLSALISSTSKAKDFFAGPSFASKRVFPPVWIWQFLCNQPCCGVVLVAVVTPQIPYYLMVVRKGWDRIKTHI